MSSQIDTIRPQKIRGTTILAAAVLAVATLGLPSVAHADGWPPSVTGTWTTRANQSSGTLVISTQSAAGNCRSITGTIFGDPLEGFYCPLSGRIGFARKNGTMPFQYYDGVLSQDGANDYMSGSFAVWSNGAEPGLYSFFASR
jgi:hypothetical protein